MAKPSAYLPKKNAKTLVTPQNLVYISPRMKTKALFSTILFAALAPANAAVLWTTTFSGANNLSRDLDNTTGDPSFTDALTGTVANLTFQDTSFSGDPFMSVGPGTTRLNNYFSPNTNVDNPAATGQNGGWWQTEFRYTGGSQEISLTSIVLDVAWNSSAGQIQSISGLPSNPRDINLSLNYSLDGGATWAAFGSSPLSISDLTVIGTAEQQHVERTFTNALDVDHATQDLWLRVRAENTGSTTGAYVNIRDITFNGSVIPEPSTALLGGLSVLALLRRRRA